MPKLLQQAQEKMLHFHNKDRQSKNYHGREVIYEKKHGEINKLNSRYKKKELRKISLTKLL